jgi:hypothetical protein
MQPVVYQGQTYYTSQYFHAYYLHNTQIEGGKGKYRRHEHFVRMLRSIAAYQKFVDAGDIVEIHWRSIKSEAIPIRDQWQPLFTATRKLTTASRYKKHTRDDHMVTAGVAVRPALRALRFPRAEQRWIERQLSEEAGDFLRLPAFSPKVRTLAVIENQEETCLT